MAKRDYILHNFWWKVTSLLLAVIVWLVVSAETSQNDAMMRTLTFPKHALAVMRDSSDKRPIRVTPTEVDITVKVPLLEGTRITDADIQAFIDLGELDLNRRKARVHVYVPRGVRLEVIYPDEASVEFLE